MDFCEFEMDSGLVEAHFVEMDRYAIANLQLLDATLAVGNSMGLILDASCSSSFTGSAGCHYTLPDMPALCQRSQTHLRSGDENHVIESSTEGQCSCIHLCCQYPLTIITTTVSDERFLFVLFSPFGPHGRSLLPQVLHCVEYSNHFLSRSIYSLSFEITSSISLLYIANITKWWSADPVRHPFAHCRSWRLVRSPIR